jgi:ankyrin repeat protein
MIFVRIFSTIKTKIDLKLIFYRFLELIQAARGGHLEVVKELVNAGADLGATTLQGGTPLWWARETLGEDNAVVHFLQVN